MRRYFIVGGRNLGSAPAVSTSVNWTDKALEPASVLFFCQVCGEVYAQTPVVRSDGSQIEYTAARGYCLRHEAPLNTQRPAGSIWCGHQYSVGFLEALPSAVLQWEFERHYQHYFERKN